MIKQNDLTRALAAVSITDSPANSLIDLSYDQYDTKLGLLGLFCANLMKSSVVFSQTFLTVELVAFASLLSTHTHFLQSLKEQEETSTRDKSKLAFAASFGPSVLVPYSEAVSVRMMRLCSSLLAAFPSGLGFCGWSPGC